MEKKLDFTKYSCLWQIWEPLCFGNKHCSHTTKSIKRLLLTGKKLWAEKYYFIGWHKKSTFIYLLFDIGHFQSLTETKALENTQWIFNWMNGYIALPHQLLMLHDIVSNHRESLDVFISLFCIEFIVRFVFPVICHCVESNCSILIRDHLPTQEP